MNKFSVLMCACLLTPEAWACGMSSTAVPFAVADQAASDAPAGLLPAPAASVAEVVRAIGARHANCDDTGLLTVVIEWPRGQYKVREVGFVFNVVSTNPPYLIFPEGPVQGRVNGRRSEFLLLWSDGAPAQQRPIDIEVEVRAVTADNRRGPPTRLRVVATPGG